MNISKSNVLHFRTSQLPQSTFKFKIGNQPYLIVEQYRYLGVIFHEKMKFREAAETLSKGERALGATISKIHSIKEIGLKTFDSLVYFCVTPVLDYCSGVLGFYNF